MEGPSILINARIYPVKECTRTKFWRSVTRQWCKELGRFKSFTLHHQEWNRSGQKVGRIDHQGSSAKRKNAVKANVRLKEVRLLQCNLDDEVSRLGFLLNRRNVWVVVGNVR